MQQGQFLGYTAGLMVSGHGQRSMVKIEFSRVGDEVALRSVSANNLSQIDRAGTLLIPWDEYDDRPIDPYDNVTEARWAFGKTGWTICGEEEEAL